jgi:excisionase family DNA binding protein
MPTFQPSISLHDAVNLHLDCRSAPALLSTCARLARCFLRSSTPPSKRLLQANEAAQYQLPYAVESEHSASPSGAHDEIRLETAQPDREIAAAQNKTVRPPAAARRQRRKKPPAKVTVPPDAKLLVGREEAAVRLSLSVRSVDYLLADRLLKFRRIGGRVLIPIAELERFARMDHPARIAS